MFLIGFMLLLMVVVTATFWNDGRPTVFRLVSPRQAAAIAAALEITSPPQQARLIAALNDGPLVVYLLPSFPGDGSSGTQAHAPYLAKLYKKYAFEMGGRPFQVQARRDARLTSLTGGWIGKPSDVRLLVGLKTGGVVVIERAPVLLQRLIARFALVAGVTAAILLLIMLYSFQQLIRPAHRLARAAHQLAANIDIPDLPTRGASEMQMLATAFNDMKRTIRGLMEERTRILAAIAHDLRTYLTRLRLRVDFVDDPDQRKRAIRDLDEMGLLLEDTLLFAQDTTTPRPAHPHPIDASNEIRSFVEMRRELGEPVDCRIENDSPLWVDCSPLAFRRMLANLTENALRYGKAAHLNACKQDGWVRIAVEDEGPGVPPEAFARLMNPFERLESSRGRQTGGAGLGLSIVLALAKAQGGELTIENVPGGGLRATISLPAAQSAASIQTEPTALQR
ncbi:MAG TPA: ATP-binding protein [Rhodanobacteraceae bacterium]|nr:ATP-binding protein [Rhodanobacteraceae bacterium]